MYEHVHNSMQIIIATYYVSMVNITLVCHFASVL